MTAECMRPANTSNNVAIQTGQKMDLTLNNCTMTLRIKQIDISTWYDLKSILEVPQSRCEVDAT